MRIIRLMTLATAMSAAVLTGFIMVNPWQAAAASGSRGGGGSQELRIQTRLTGGAINGVVPSGNARFRSRTGSSNFSVEVEDVNLPNGTVLTVTLNRGGAILPAGSLTLTARFGEIDVNTKDGDVVPQAQSGDIVVVSGGGDPLLTGVLR